MTDEWCKRSLSSLHNLPSRPDDICAQLCPILGLTLQFTMDKNIRRFLDKKYEGSSHKQTRACRFLLILVEQSEFLEYILRYFRQIKRYRVCMKEQFVGAFAVLFVTHM